MTITYRGGVAIAEIIVYVPALLLALYCVFKHGSTKASGWRFLLIFCLVRIIGSGCEIAITTTQNPSSGVITTAAVLNSLGLSPLLLSTLGFISRVYSSISRTSGNLAHVVVIRGLQTVFTVGLILCIVGATGNSTPATVATTTKVGIILFLVGYLAFWPLVIFAGFQRSKIENGEKRLLVAIIIALPILFVRLLYSLISALGHSHDFNLVMGSVTILLCMAIIEEVAITIIYLGTGLFLRKLAPEEQPVSSPSRRERRRRGGRGGLVGLAMNAVNDMRDQEGKQADSHGIDLEQQRQGQHYQGQQYQGQHYQSR